MENTLFDGLLYGDQENRTVGEGSDRPESEVSKNPERGRCSIIEKEERPLERLKELDEKIAGAISKVKVLKDEKQALEQKIRGLETLLNEKGQEVERLASEKAAIKVQIEELLKELEIFELK
jgi:septal ring factor EnvC (AmiA/AmiB activator)